MKTLFALNLILPVLSKCPVLNFFKYKSNVSNLVKNETNRFIESGMYPEGNVYAGGVGNINSQFLMSGDLYYFRQLETNYGMKHVTVFNSLVYHIQEGEKDV